MRRGRRDLPDAVEAHFSAEAASYSEASTSGFWKWWRAREHRAVMAMIGECEGQAILDAGSGTGYYSDLLLKAGAQVVAVDLSLPMVSTLRRRLGIPAFVANLEELRLRRRFDTILCAGALEFCPHPERAIARMAAHIPSDGRLVAMLPADDISGRLYRRFHARHGLQIQLFTLRRLRKIARRSRMQLEAVRRIGFNYVVRFRRN